MAENFIGSRISLISQSQRRYEGVLHALDGADSTLILENGKIYVYIFTNRKHTTIFFFFLLEKKMDE